MTLLSRLPKIWLLSISRSKMATLFDVYAVQLLLCSVGKTSLNQFSPAGIFPSRCSVIHVLCYVLNQFARFVYRAYFPVVTRPIRDSLSSPVCPTWQYLCQSLTGIRDPRLGVFHAVSPSFRKLHSPPRRCLSNTSNLFLLWSSHRIYIHLI